MTEIKIDKLAAALSAAQADMQTVHKAQEGYGYKYADLASILEMARPILQAHGLAVVQLPVSCDDGQAGLETIIMHTSGQSIARTYSMPVEKGKGMSLAQAHGAVITYMRRYSLASALLISQEDNDAAIERQQAVQKTFPGAKIQGPGVEEVQAKQVMLDSIMDVSKALWGTEWADKLRAWMGAHSFPRSADMTLEQAKMAYEYLRGEKAERDAIQGQGELL